MRRLLVSAVLGAALLATTACGGNPTRPGAVPSPGTVVASGSSAPGAAVPSASPGASVAPGGPKSPVPGAAAGLSASDRAICTGREEVHQKVGTTTQRYVGLVEGRIAGGDPAKRQVLADLQKALMDYRDHLARRVSGAVDQRLASAMRADVSYLSKRLTELRAAGTDYDGKVFRVVDTMAKGASKDQRVPGVCAG